METSVEKRQPQKTTPTFKQFCFLIHVRESIHYFARIELDHH